MEIGAGCSSSMTSPRTSCFSNCPRGGSFMKKARIATMTTGIPSRNHAHRQPSVPPAQVAMAAHRTGLASPMPCAPMFITADMRADTDRVVVGDQRLVHRDAVRLGDAGREAGPEQHERADREPGGEHEPPNARLAHPTIGTRFTRSASQPIGTAPSTKNADDAVTMNTIVPELMWNVRRISGARTLMAAPSSSSNESSNKRTTNMSLPPTLNASENETSSEPTPGRRSSGKMTCSRESFCASSRLSSSASTVAARDAALPTARVRVRQRDPPEPVTPCSAAERTGFTAERNSYETTVLEVQDRVIDDAAQQFERRGWVVLDVLPRSTLPLLASWADDVTAVPESSGVLQHREQTDGGAQLCRSEHFVEVHAGLRELLTSGPMLDIAARAAR